MKKHSLHMTWSQASITALRTPRRDDEATTPPQPHEGKPGNARPNGLAAQWNHADA